MSFWKVSETFRLLHIQLVHWNFLVQNLFEGKSSGFYLSAWVENFRNLDRKLFDKVLVGRQISFFWNISKKFLIFFGVSAKFFRDFESFFPPCCQKCLVCVQRNFARQNLKPIDIVLNFFGVKSITLEVFSNTNISWIFVGKKKIKTFCCFCSVSSEFFFQTLSEKISAVLSKRLLCVKNQNLGKSSFWNSMNICLSFCIVFGTFLRFQKEVTERFLEEHSTSAEKQFGSEIFPGKYWSFFNAA